MSFSLVTLSRLPSLARPLAPGFELKARCSAVTDIDLMCILRTVRVWPSWIVLRAPMVLPGQGFGF